MVTLVQERSNLTVELAQDPAHVDTWRDGLWAAVRILARHYNVQVP
jgi:hypothetical protein